MDLNDYRQNYLVAGSVKTTFFCPDPEIVMHLGSGAPRGPRVATLEEVFAMKCLVVADRSKTRDWFDLFTLMRHHGFMPAQFEQVFATSRVPQKMEIALARLTSGRPHELDEGYDALLANPPTLDEMSEFFSGVGDEARAAAAERVMRQMRKG